MKKTLIATAVAAGVLASGAAQASPTVYGILHFSVNALTDKIYSGTTLVESDGLDMTSNTSAVGVKGSEDLGGGLKAIYKAEFKITPFGGDPEGGSLQRRDVWIGLKGGWGKAAAGTMSNNYKQMGSKVDPLWRTQVEGRGDLNMMSGAHGGAGTQGQGRSEQTLQYTTPKMAGIELVLQTTLSNADGDQAVSGGRTISNDETVGVGIRWSNKSFLLYADYLDPNAPGTGAFNCTTNCDGDETIAKLGGKWANKAFQVSAQYEMTEDQTGGDYTFLNGLWNINKKNMVTLSYGMQDKISSAFALGYAFKMSKQSNVYAAYGMVDADTCTTGGCSYDLGDKSDGTPLDSNGVISLGIRKSF